MNNNELRDQHLAAVPRLLLDLAPRCAPLHAAIEQWASGGDLDAFARCHGLLRQDATRLITEAREHGTELSSLAVGAWPEGTGRPLTDDQTRALNSAVRRLRTLQATTRRLAETWPVPLMPNVVGKDGG